MGFFAFLKAKPKSRKKQMKSGLEIIVISNYKTSRSYESAESKKKIKSSVSISSQTSNSAKFEEKEKPVVFRVFKLAELRSATNDFNRSLKIGKLRSATNDFDRTLKIGEGGFGSVYKGFVKGLDEKSGRIAVAVKVLNQRGWKGRKEWLAEVQLLGVLEHPNVVKLVGYCSDDEKRNILVYEYMPNKSLYYHLFDRASPPLPFNVRLKIALGAAEGLAYLHEGLELQVIHRDFKPSNVLLDGDFNPKLSDFGLAREGPTGDQTYVSSMIVGTIGYLAPEYAMIGHVSTKSDVWGFGVVLYELLTGRCAARTEERMFDLIEQFPIESKRFNMIMDPRLRYHYSMKSVREIAKLANRCLAAKAKERPKMSEVVGVLKQVVEMTEMASGGKVEGKRPESSSS